MRSRAALLLVALLLSTLPVYASAQWLTHLEEAVSRATSEKKPLLVHLRGNCGRCNRRIDDLLGAAEKHEPIVRAYESFVLCRLDPGGDLTELEMFSDETVRRPSVALLSPGGMYLLLNDARDLNEYMSFLSRVRGQKQKIASIDSLLAEGSQLQAEMTAGRIALMVGEYDRAKFLFKRLRSEFEAAGDEQNAEMAFIEERFAEYRSLTVTSLRLGIIRQLLSIADSTKFRANAAEIYLRQAVASRDPNTAAEYFRRAFDDATPASESWAIAGRWLVNHNLLQLQGEAPKKSVIHVVKPLRATVTGRIEITAECAAEVARVAWFYDGTAVASDSSPPFTARIDLGGIPRLHTIQARAYDAKGYAIGESQIMLNDRLDAFHVSIVTPVEPALSGPVTIEAEAEVPAGTRIITVELMWNEQTIARMTAPPYRARFDVPKEFGFIRAVATLDDGRIAEETKPVNEREFSMPVSVHDIVFPVTVVDRKGPVAGLQPEDFVVKDEGAVVPVTFQREEGSILGLAIDSSSSMSRSLLDVMEMSAEVIASAVTPADKAFLMAFDDRPYMLQMTTSDEARLKNAAYELMPAGTTSLFDAIAFGLQQFTGLAGRRALVVMTDGIDIRSDQSGASCARMAREIGVRVYIVVTKDAIPFGSQGMQRGNQASLEKIADETGGGIFYAPTLEEQRKIFARIRGEVRGQYLLAFTAPQAKPGTWRTIKVETPKVRGTVRTIAGYYAR